MVGFGAMLFAGMDRGKAFIEGFSELFQKLFGFRLILFIFLFENSFTINLIELSIEYDLLGLLALLGFGMNFFQL